MTVVRQVGSSDAREISELAERAGCPSEPFALWDQRPLTPREAALLSEYLVDRKPLKAALRAGFPKSTAGLQAAEMLQRPAVRAAIRSHDLEARRDAEAITKLERGRARAAQIGR
ncbi:MAG: terminase small subunit [Methylocella sp.]